MQWVKEQRKLLAMRCLPLLDLPESRPVEKWERDKRAVLDPASTLQDAKDGKLSPSSVEALKETKPALYADAAGQARVARLR